MKGDVVQDVLLKIITLVLALMGAGILLYVLYLAYIWVKFVLTYV